MRDGAVQEELPAYSHLTVEELRFLVTFYDEASKQAREIGLDLRNELARRKHEGLLDTPPPT